jgi:hypothetical protein
MYTCKFDLHVERCSSLSGAYEVWESAGNIIVLDRLRQTHQGRHLAIEDVDCPPNFAASLDKRLAQVLNWHIRMHALDH